jgi:superoxide reductase
LTKLNKLTIKQIYSLKKERIMAKTKKLEIYRCNVCGNIVEVLNPGAQALVCCGEPMELLSENDTDAATEKHVPVIEKIDGGYKVKVGDVPHPMTEEHYIQWIELIADDQVLTAFLKPNEAPEAVFYTNAKEVTAREYCNLHGHWKSK